MVSLLCRVGALSGVALDWSPEDVGSGAEEIRGSKIRAEMIPAAISSTASTSSRLIQRRRRCGAAGGWLAGLACAGRGGLIGLDPAFALGGPPGRMRV